MAGAVAMALGIATGNPLLLAAALGSKGDSPTRSDCEVCYPKSKSNEPRRRKLKFTSAYDSPCCSCCASKASVREHDKKRTDRPARRPKCEGGDRSRLLCMDTAEKIEMAERSDKAADISKLMNEVADLQANPALRKPPLNTPSSPVEGDWSADDVFFYLVPRYDAFVAFQEEYPVKLKEIEDKLKELRDLLIRQDRDAYDAARRRYKEAHPL